MKLRERYGIKMDSYIMMIAVLLPMIGGVFIPFLPFRKRSQMAVYIETIVLITSVLTFMLIFNRPEDAFILFRFTGQLSISFRLDAAGSVFATILAFMWPLSTLYSFEYMKHEGHEKMFFMFYTLTYGMTLGIAMAEDIVTLYFFYEMLTLVTVPLVLHTLSREAVLATRTYLYYSLGGAAFAFIGMIFILIYGDTSNFIAGGVIDLSNMGNNINLLLIIYVICFCGFSVKAAMCPFSDWLPQAGVAPTPVTALLHAVAVVKAGAFATMRITYFSFGTELLRGTWAQYLLMTLAIFTIVFGCSRALKETHFKRRLAWSTVSNLSYILFGVLLMTPLGLAGAFTHMLSHALMKICAFFCAGAVIYKTGRNYIYQLDGFGRKMPKVFVIYTISAMALMGVPGLCGFVSKWYLAKAAVASLDPLGYIGLAAILVSALLTAIYMLTVAVRAFFPAKDFNYESISDVEDPNWIMILPLVIFVAAMFMIGLHPQFMSDVIADVVTASF